LIKLQKINKEMLEDRDNLLAKITEASRKADEHFR